MWKNIKTLCEKKFNFFDNGSFFSLIILVPLRSLVKIQSDGKEYKNRNLEQQLNLWQILYCKGFWSGQKLRFQLETVWLKNRTFPRRFRLCLLIYLHHQSLLCLYLNNKESKSQKNFQKMKNWMIFHFFHNVTDLKKEFSQDIMAQSVLRGLNGIRQASQSLKLEAVNATMEILYKKCKRKPYFGHRRSDILHNKLLIS